MTPHRLIVLRHATPYLVVAASLLTRGVKPACDDPKVPDVSMVTHSPDGFSVPGLVNSFQCRRLCQRTTGCSRVVFDSGAMAGSRNCILILSPPSTPSATVATATTEGQQAGTEDGMTCQLTCDNMPCGYGETCSRGYNSTAPTYLCHSLMRCGYTPILLRGYLKALPKDTLLGTTVKYSCHAPYAFQGPNPTATCTYTGHWAGLSGACVQFMTVPGYKTSLIQPHIQAYTYEEAKGWCYSQYRGHLVSFHDDTKWRAVANAVALYGFTVSFIYVDGYEVYGNDSFFLHNGQEMKLNDAWYPTEPNSFLPPAERCLAVGKGKGLTVFDVQCSMRLNFICEVTVDA